MITVRADSVGGHPCMVFYRDGKPIWTWWGNNGSQLFKHPSFNMDDLSLEHLKALLETLKALNVTYPELAAAIEAFFREHKH